MNEKQGEIMRVSKGFSVLFGFLGVLLAAAVLAVCVLNRNAEPRMLLAPEGAARCADALLSSICSGDYEGASAYLVGNPALTSGQQMETEVAEQIWDAFTGSLQYELVGSCYAVDSGVAQNVKLRYLEIPSVTENLKQRAGQMLEQRVEAAQTMAEVYDDSHEYREDFVKLVLQDAVSAAIAEDGRYAEQSLTLKLVCDRGQWLVVPDEALLNAISGGILG